jgi:hypothetical protein
MHNPDILMTVLNITSDKLWKYRAVCKCWKTIIDSTYRPQKLHIEIDLNNTAKVGELTEVMKNILVDVPIGLEIDPFSKITTDQIDQLFTAFNKVTDITFDDYLSNHIHDRILYNLSNISLKRLNINSICVVSGRSVNGDKSIIKCKRYDHYNCDYRHTYDYVCNCDYRHTYDYRQIRGYIMDTIIKLGSFEAKRKYCIYVYPNLEHLTLANCSDWCFLTICDEMRQLKSLDLHGVQRLTDMGTYNIGNLVNLEHLNLNTATDKRTPFTEGTYEKISKLPKLKSINVCECQANMHDFEILMESKSLEIIEFEFIRHFTDTEMNMFDPGLHERACQGVYYTVILSKIGGLWYCDRHNQISSPHM